MLIRACFGKNRRVLLGETVSAAKTTFFSILRRKERGHLYGGREGNRCVRTGVFLHVVGKHVPPGITIGELELDLPPTSHRNPRSHVCRSIASSGKVLYFSFPLEGG